MHIRDVVVGDAPGGIVDAEEALRQAQLGADVAALDRLIAGDMLFTGPTGEIATKEQDLEAHRSGMVRFVEHEPMELRVRMVGAAVAIAALKARLAVQVNGKLERGTFRYTRVWWVGSDGAWRVAGGHVSATSVESSRPVTAVEKSRVDSGTGRWRWGCLYRSRDLRDFVKQLAQSEARPSDSRCARLHDSPRIVTFEEQFKRFLTDVVRGRLVSTG